LDPPAFAKKRGDLSHAIKGYRRLFSIALKKIPSRGLLCLSSCSYYISPSLFEIIAREAAALANRSVQVISYHALAPDHPVNLFHPESAYLKSLFLFVK